VEHSNFQQHLVMWILLANKSAIQMFVTVMNMLFDNFSRAVDFQVWARLTTLLILEKVTSHDTIVDNGLKYCVIEPSHQVMPLYSRTKSWKV